MRSRSEFVSFVGKKGVFHLGASSHIYAVERCHLIDVKATTEGAASVISPSEVSFSLPGDGVEGSELAPGWHGDVCERRLPGVKAAAGVGGHHRAGDHEN